MNIQTHIPDALQGYGHAAVEISFRLHLKFHSYCT